MTYPVWDTIYRGLVRAAPGVWVIQRDQDGRLPDRPFIAAKLIAETREGHPLIGRLTDEGTIFIQQGALFTLSIHVFGPDAFQLCHGVQNGLNKISVQDFLRSRGVAYIQTLGGPTDLAAIAGTEFEGRAHMDIQLRANIEVVDDVGLIERVELTGTVDSLTFTKTIGV